MSSTPRILTVLLATLVVVAPAHAQTVGYDDPLLSGYGDSGAMEQALLGSSGLDGGGGSASAATPLPERADGTVDLRARTVAPAGASEGSTAPRRGTAAARGTTPGVAVPAASGAPPLAARPTELVASAPLPLAELLGLLLLALLAGGAVVAARRGAQTPLAG